MSFQKLVILDRDGVINQDPGGREYVKSLQEFKFLPRSKEAIKMLKSAGFKVCIASNQAGVSKGLYTIETLNEITEKMQEELSAAGAKIDEIYYCTHKNEDNCDCRKPKTGLLKQVAGGEAGENTYFIGDTLRDIQTGQNFGCKTILVLSGKIKNKKEINKWEILPGYIAKDLFEAAGAIIKGKV